jgi:hypothetical protein
MRKGRPADGLFLLTAATRARIDKMWGAALRRLFFLEIIFLTLK